MQCAKSSCARGRVDCSSNSCRSADCLDAALDPSDFRCDLVLRKGFPAPEPNTTRYVIEWPTRSFMAPPASESKTRYNVWITVIELIERATSIAKHSRVCSSSTYNSFRFVYPPIGHWAVIPTPSAA